jgi:CRP-like cAMP-binding protein
MHLSRAKLSSNGIAKHLTPGHLHRLETISTAVDLAGGQVLEPDPSGERPLYFLVDAVASVWIERGVDAPRLAIALVGNEGVVGLSHLWASSATPWVSRVLKPGLAYQTTGSELRTMLEQVPDFAKALSQFLWNQTQEIAQYSARTQQGDIRTRLALWLHLLLEKTGDQFLEITHQELADMLGTRRVSITITAGLFQDEGILSLRRGAIHIRNPQALAQAAGLPPT